MAVLAAGPSGPARARWSRVLGCGIEGCGGVCVAGGVFRYLLLLLACWLVLPVAASDGVQPDREDQQVMSSWAFLNAHPDLKFRREGWLAYEEGDFEQARTHFLASAGFADKLSQAMLAEMAWTGRGQPVDRPLGYAWADLAAERGYPQFVVLRESYWSALDPAEREHAIERGQSLLAEYADEVARPRMAGDLRKARRQMIAGRPNRSAVVRIPGKGGLWTTIRGHDFYANKFWEPKYYEAWTDAVWTEPPRGKVEVGAPERVGQKTP